MSGPAAPAPGADVAGLRRDVHNALAAVGAEMALRWLPPEHHLPADRAKVVVVGEVGTGKTALINALLGRPDLLPTTTTRTYVGVGAGDHDELRVHLRGGEVITGPLTDIGQWMHDAQRRSDQVAHIEVLLAEPWLAELSLFDTPGVAGGDPAAHALTLQALQEATALIFVCSAEAKISVSERNFLKEATRCIEHVTFVLSKVDLLEDLGEQNLRENEETIRNDVRFPPDGRFGDLCFVPFSAALAVEGTRGDEQALADSGVAELRHRLERIVAAHAELARLNEVRAMRSALSEAYRHLGERKKALEDPDRAGRHESLQTRYAKLREHSGSWQRQAARGLDFARDEVRHQLRRDIRDLRSRYDERLATLKKSEFAATEAALLEDLSELQHRTQAAITTHVGEIAQRMFGLAGMEAAADELTEQLPGPREALPDFVSPRPPAPKDPAERARSAQMLYFAYFMSKNLIKSPHLAPLIPFTTVTWFAYQRRMTGQAADLAGLRNWVSRSITEAQDYLADEVINHTFKQAEYQLIDGVELAFRNALSEVGEQLKVLNADTADIQREQKRIDTQNDRIHELARRSEAYLRALAPAATPEVGSAATRD